MFELTINGKTGKFETAAEMEAWRQRMTSPTKKKFFNKKKRSKSFQKNGKKT